jgi:hypothetical protein
MATDPLSEKTVTYVGCAGDCKSVALCRRKVNKGLALGRQTVRFQADKSAHQRTRDG